jgi:hypothetical protein
VRFCCGFGNVEFLRKQPQLIGAQLFAARAAFGGEQLAQQPLCLVQLGGQIHQHLLQDRRIFRQAVAVDGHYRNYKGKTAIYQDKNASEANVYAASAFLR